MHRADCRMGTQKGIGMFIVALMLAITAAGDVLGASPKTGAVPASFDTSADGAFAQAVNEVIGLRVSQVVTLDIDVQSATSDERVIAVPYGQEVYTLVLWPHSVRSPIFEVKAQIEDGSYVEVDAGPVRTYRGTILEVEGSSVAASILEDGLRARIELDEQTSLWVEPIGDRVFGANANDYVVYDNDDVIPHGGTCLVKHGPLATTVGDVGEETGGVAGIGNYLVELACDADREYFLRYGTVEATEARIESTINLVNLQYERDVDLTFIITTIIVRTSEPDPYSTTNPGGILDQFTSHWNSSQGGIQRDVAHLFTGKNINGGVIGIAWLQNICTGLAYSVVESDCCGATACRTDLSAHELGHNWSAQHCNCVGWTMNPFLTCANRFISNTSIPSIMNYRSSRLGCLDANAQLQRIVIAGPTEVDEGTEASYTATAMFTLGDNQDVTIDATWGVDPPSAGSISRHGLFTAAQVNSDTAASITASFADESGSAFATFDITVIDATPPDPRNVAVTLIPSVAPHALFAGQSFTVDVSLAAPDGDINEIRLLQLDTSLSTGVTVDAVTWDIEGIENALYSTFQLDDVYSDFYSAQGPIPGFIFDLGGASVIVAHLDVTFQGDGVLNIFGDPAPPSLDFGIRFRSGFGEIIEFTGAAGNVQGGTIALSEGTSSLAIASSIPPDGAIDARQPADPITGSPAGLQTIALVFNQVPPVSLSPSDFSVTQDGGTGPVPTVVELVLGDALAVQVTLSDPIEPGAWTTITHTPSGTGPRFGYLPADVSGDGTSTPADILDLIDSLNGVGNARPIWSTDINRSQLAEPSDILTVIDLLNGAGDFNAWNGVSLP